MPQNDNNHLTGNATDSNAFGSATTHAPSGPGTIDDFAQQLQTDYWVNRGSDPHKWNMTTHGGTLDVDITALSAEAQQLARWSFQAWSDATGITFNEVASGAGAEITFVEPAAGTGQTAVTNAGWSLPSGDMTSATVTISADWLSFYGTSMNSYSFQTYLHEIGHALGLGHAGDYDVSATYPTDATFTNDSWQMTLMSYFDQVDNTTITADKAYTMTPMVADYVAVQNMYGPASANTGDTTYFEMANTGSYLDDLWGQIYGEDAPNTALYDPTVLTPTAFTILDTGGTDTFNLMNSTWNEMIDLRPEAISDVNGVTGNVIIARGTTIENVTTGTGDDTITGNDAANTINTGAGDDTIIVTSQAAGIGDTIDGGTAGTDNDTLDLTAAGNWRYKAGTVTNDADGNSTSGVIEFLDATGTTVTGEMTFNEIENVLCFAPGTMIATPGGEVAVEALRIGDAVLTEDGRSVPVKWIGRQTLQRVRYGPHMQPVRIRAGALGDGLPHSDLTVTADHGMILDRLVINASALVNGSTIDFVPLAELEDSFTVYHVETEGHEIILANGATSETFVDAVTRSHFDNHGEYLALYGAERIIPEMPAPRIASQRLLPQAIRARLGIGQQQRESLRQIA